MIELNVEQQRALDGEQPLRVVDPRTATPYIVIRLDVYDRLRQLVEDETATADLVDRVMAEDDANDPYLAEYQRLYSSQTP